MKLLRRTSPLSAKYSGLKLVVSLFWGMQGEAAASLFRQISFSLLRKKKNPQVTVLRGLKKRTSLWRAGLQLWESDDYLMVVYCPVVSLLQVLPGCLVWLFSFAHFLLSFPWGGLPPRLSFRGQHRTRCGLPKKSCSSSHV